MWDYFSVLPAFAVLLCFTSFVLQLVALPSTNWAFFTARVDLGKPEERGHYGLWSICSTKAPHWVEDCDPLDTFFQLPTYAGASGAVAIIHLLLLCAAFLPLAVVRLVQVTRDLPDLCLRPKVVCLGKVSAAFASVILDIVICVLASVGENRFPEYEVHKGWAFWIQISDLILDLLLALICALENIQYWQLESMDAGLSVGDRDPTGELAETYGNPTFDNSSPREVRRKEAGVYVTPASGLHYGSSYTASEATGVGGDSDTSSRPPRKPHSVHQQNGHTRSNANDVTDVRIKEGGATVITIGSLSYENPAFRDQSPSSRKKRAAYRH